MDLLLFLLFSPGYGAPDCAGDGAGRKPPRAANDDAERDEGALPREQEPAPPHQSEDRGRPSSGAMARAAPPPT